MYLKFLDMFQEWVPSTREGKVLCHYTSADRVQGTAPTFARPQSLTILSVETIKIPRAIGVVFQKNKNFSNTIFMPVQALPPPGNLRKGATVHDQKCPCEHCCRWRTSGAFVVNCDLINSKNSTVFKLGKCII